jgi:hypothetical protein
MRKSFFILAIEKVQIQWSESGPFIVMPFDI